MNESETVEADGKVVSPAHARRFSVTGMHCAACSMRVERAVKKTPGVTACAVSLLTNEMSVSAGAFLPLFGWKRNPDLCALVHGLSSVCVVTNALRLNFVRLDRSPKPAALTT